MNVIDIKNLSFHYGKHPFDVLKNLNLSLQQGESVGLIGANGVGKSTLLKLLVGIETDYQGDLHIFDLPVDAKHIKAVRQHIGYVFQDSEAQLFMPSVYDDVSFAPRNARLSDQEVEARTLKALDMVGIRELKDRQIYRLSGGEKKLTAIATVLSLDPDILIFDEPSVALDPRNRRRLIEVIKRLPCTKLIASHDLDFIYDVCDRVLLLDEGNIVADGDGATVLSNQDLLEAHGLELPLSLSRGGKL